jgi:hypothetical protein
MDTVLFDPTVDSSILTRGYLQYAQLPVFPIYPEPPFDAGTIIYDPVPSLYTPTGPANAGNLNTNGTPFNGIPGYNALLYLAANGNTAFLPTARLFSADANTGYAGFTNYTINFDDIDLNSIDLDDLEDLEASLILEPVNPSFPALDPTAGVTVAFDLTIFQESSAPNRAGFSLVAVSSDTTKEIEIGFKTAGADRAVALSENFVEAENSSATALDFSQTRTYWLSLSGDRYSLSANGVEILSGNLRNYAFNPATSDPPLPTAANPYAIPNFLFLGDNTDQAHANFQLGKISVLPLQTSLTNDLLDDYIASNGDLIFALGYNLAAAKTHYLNAGFAEGRPIDTFAEDLYLASHGDLIHAFGYDLAAATKHYIEAGVAEGRSLKRFLPGYYLDTYGDLKAAFGNDLAAATRHYIQYGYKEGRDPFFEFEGGAYIASYDDLINAFGYNPAAGLQHFIDAGYDEGRQITFEADDYIASYGDLIGAFGYDLAAGTEHFIRYGVGEGRVRDGFDEVAYLNKYSDLKAAFGDDGDAATWHYIVAGFAEGRTV